MKTCTFLVTFSLAIFMVSAFSTEEHVRRHFRPEHRVYLPEPGTLNLEEDESAVAVPQNDASTKCLSVCEPKCDKLNVPSYLQVKNNSTTDVLFLVYKKRQKHENVAI